MVPAVSATSDTASARTSDGGRRRAGRPREGQGALRPHRPAQDLAALQRALAGRDDGLGDGRRAPQGRALPFRRRLPDPAHRRARSTATSREYFEQPGLQTPRLMRMGLAASRQRLVSPLATSVIRRQMLAFAQRFIFGRDAAAALPKLRDAAPARPRIHPRRARRGLRRRSRGRGLSAALPGAPRRPPARGRLVATGPGHRQGCMGRRAAGQRLHQDHLAVLADRRAQLPRLRGGGQGAPAPHLPQGPADRRLRQPRPRAVPLPGPHVRRVQGAARGGRVRRLRRGRRRRAGLPARRRGRHSRPHRLGARARARHHRATRQGRLLGLRDGAGRPGGLAGAGLHAQAGLGRDVRAHHAPHARAPRADPLRLRQPQRALAGPRHRHGGGSRPAPRRLRAADAARHGRAHQGGHQNARPAAARVCARRRAHPRHGLLRAPAAREHGQRVVPAADVRRGRGPGPPGPRAAAVTRRRPRRRSACRPAAPPTWPSPGRS